jgi:GT2 family glycosyltransferase
VSLSAPLVSIVIIHYHSGDYIFDCINAISQQTYPSVEVIVIDNDSQDAASIALKRLATEGEITYLLMSTNAGASAANNRGIKAAVGDFVLVLNADVFLEPNFIARGMQAFDKNVKIGTVTGKLVAHHDTSYIDSTGVVLFRDGVGIDRGHGEKDKAQYDKAEYVIGACCAAAIYRKSMLQEIAVKNQYFSEVYFAFIEDLDLSVIATLHGWLTYYEPAARGQHVRGGSTESVSDFVKFLKLRNEMLFYNKVFGDVRSVAYCLLRLSRWLTNSPMLMWRARKDSLRLRPQIVSRLSGGGNFPLDKLEPYMHGSYVLFRVKERLYRMLGLN